MQIQHTKKDEQIGELFFLSVMKDEDLLGVNGELVEIVMVREM